MAPRDTQVPIIKLGECYLLSKRDSAKVIKDLGDRGAWLAQLEEHMTLDPRVVSLSPIFSVEIIQQQQQQQQLREMNHSQLSRRALNRISSILVRGRWRQI